MKSLATGVLGGLAVACSLVGLVTLPGVVDRRPVTPPLAAAADAEPVESQLDLAAAPAATFASAEPSEEAPVEEPVDPEIEWLRAQAQRLPDHFYAGLATADGLSLSGGVGGVPEGLVPRDWQRNFTTDAEFVYESPSGRRWITVTTARVPCERVDRALARNPAAASPDRCAATLAQAQHVLQRYGVDANDPMTALQELGIDPSVRVLLVYAGWQRDPNEAGAIRLIESHVAPVYPRRGFTERRREALDGIYEAMKLGPYAES